MLDRIEHEKQISKLLFDIYSYKDTSVLLGFKGGTACYFFYNLPRFSTDLDFNLLDISKSDFVYRKILAILANYGTIKDQHIKANTIYFLLNSKAKSQNIKIEISLRSSKVDQYEIKHLLGLPVLTLVKSCLAAHKLVAIFDRKRLAHRDLFDAWYFLKNDWPVSEEIIKERTGKIKSEYFAYLAREIEKLGRINILHGLGEVLDHRQKAWTKEKLMPELIYLLKLNSK